MRLKEIPMDEKFTAAPEIKDPKRKTIIDLTLDQEVREAILAVYDGQKESCESILRTFHSHPGVVKDALRAAGLRVKGEHLNRRDDTTLVTKLIVSRK